MAPEGTTYKNMVEYEGTYCVAGNVTCMFDGAKTGTLWQWQAQFGNGKTPGKNNLPFAPDHTLGIEGFGGMLFVNCANEPDGIIYENTIKGIKERDLTIKCYINNFSTSTNPVKVYIRAFDLETKDTMVSDCYLRYANESSGLDWIEISLPIKLKGSNLKLEIVSAAGGNTYNRDGNDLVLDDIQIWALESKHDTEEETGINVAQSSSTDAKVNVFTPLGILVKENVSREEATTGLKRGIYFVGKEKVVVK